MRFTGCVRGDGQLNHNAAAGGARDQGRWYKYGSIRSARAERHLASDCSSQCTQRQLQLLGGLLCVAVTQGQTQLQSLARPHMTRHTFKSHVGMRRCPEGRRYDQSQRCWPAERRCPWSDPRGGLDRGGRQSTQLRLQTLQASEQLCLPRHQLCVAQASPRPPERRASRIASAPAQRPRQRARAQAQQSS